MWTAPAAPSRTVPAAHATTAGPLDEHGGQRGGRAEDERRAERVEPLPGAARGGGQQPPAREDRPEGDGQVDEEDPAPARREQQPADDGAAARAERGDGRPDPHDGRVLAGREGGQREPERCRDEHRARRRLQHPGGDEHAERGCGGAGGGREPEQRHPEQERGAAAGVVGEPPGGDEQRGEHDRVGVQHPGHVGERGVPERVAQRGERRADREQVEDREELRRRGDGEDAPAAGVDAGGRLRQGVRRHDRQSRAPPDAARVARLPQSARFLPCARWPS
jgi:hypothetical protein